jgi:Flp pilus assembly pilin Flp
MILFEYVNRVMAWHQSRDRGASAVEYALLLTFVALVVIVGITAFGSRLNGMFNSVCQKLNSNVAC